MTAAAYERLACLTALAALQTGGAWGAELHHAWFAYPSRRASEHAQHHRPDRGASMKVRTPRYHRVPGFRSVSQTFPRKRRRARDTPGDLGARHPSRLRLSTPADKRSVPRRRDSTSARLGSRPPCGRRGRSRSLGPGRSTGCRRCSRTSRRCSARGPRSGCSRRRSARCIGHPQGPSPRSTRRSARRSSRRRPAPRPRRRRRRSRSRPRPPCLRRPAYS